MAERAVILFAHGARDARWSETLGRLQALVQADLPAAHVGIAYLEFQPPTLLDAIDHALAEGVPRIDVMPVFWANGGHIGSDLTPMLAGLRARQPGLEVRVLPVLSELPGMLEFIARAIATPGR